MTLIDKITNMKIFNTTRGTSRQRAPKGFSQATRYAILADTQPELLDQFLLAKLRRMSAVRRVIVKDTLRIVPEDERKELVLRLLVRPAR